MQKVDCLKTNETNLATERCVKVAGAEIRRGWRRLLLGIRDDLLSQVELI